MHAVLMCAFSPSVRRCGVRRGASGVARQMAGCRGQDAGELGEDDAAKVFDLS